jgi:hypothetical protein
VSGKAKPSQQLMPRAAAANQLLRQGLNMDALNASSTIILCLPPGHRRPSCARPLRH